jgi:hypothetical protein
VASQGPYFLENLFYFDSRLCNHYLIIGVAPAYGGACPIGSYLAPLWTSLNSISTFKSLHWFRPANDTEIENFYRLATRILTTSKYQP